MQATYTQLNTLYWQPILQLLPDRDQLVHATSKLGAQAGSLLGHVLHFLIVLTAFLLSTAYTTTRQLMTNAVPTLIQYQHLLSKWLTEYIPSLAGTAPKFIKHFSLISHLIKVNKEQAEIIKELQARPTATEVSAAAPLNETQEVRDTIKEHGLFSSEVYQVWQKLDVKYNVRAQAPNPECRVVMRPEFLGFYKYSYDLAMGQVDTSQLTEQEGKLHNFIMSRIAKGVTTKEQVIESWEQHRTPGFLHFYCEEEEISPDALYADALSYIQLTEEEDRTSETGWTLQGWVTADEVKSHYKCLAKKCHPDISGDSELFYLLREQYYTALAEFDILNLQEQGAL